MIIEQLRATVPGLGHVDVVTSPDHRLILRLHDASFDSPLLARHASDGTLTMLAHLVLLADPAPAPLLALEAPETFVYPSLLPSLANAWRNAGERSQVVLTTHSPEFLAAFDPGEVIELQRGADGYTRLTHTAERHDV